MKPTRLAISFLTFAVFAVFTAGCEELDLFLLPPDGSSAPAPLSSSSDPAVKAAGASSDAVDDIRKADALLDKGLKNKDPGAIAEAVRVRPGDPSLRYHQAAILIAIDNQPEAVKAFREGGHLIIDDESADYLRQTANAQLLWLDALRATMAQYTTSSAEYGRLNKVYCDNIADSKDYEPLGLALQLYPTDSCK